MTDSPYSWLAAREGVDRRCRSLELAAEFAAAVTTRDQVVDLGCGTGANYRYLVPLLKPHVTWLLIDNDTQILQSAAHCIPADSVRLEQGDLAIGISAVADRQAAAFTASAFLDMVSEDWIRRFVEHVHRRPLLIAMTSSGLPCWDPIDELDSVINQCLDRHQRCDHRFGPALGSDAVACLADQLRSKGSDPKLQTTDWELSPSDSAMIEMIVGGIARRVRGYQIPVDIDGWESRRMKQMKLSQLQLTWPHLDLLSIP